jgi:hypothetical protein
MAYEAVFKELNRMEECGIRSIIIHATGIMEYLHNSPRVSQNIDPLQRKDEDTLLYVVPRNGDLLLTVTVSGSFESAELFQYDWTGSRRTVYVKLEKPGTMNPFPYSGFPLLQCGKALYLSLSKPVNAQVSVTYAFLETTSRRALAQHISPNSHDGIKVTHANGDLYQAVNVTDHGYSPNYLALIGKDNEVA